MVRDVHSGALAHEASAPGTPTTQRIKGSKHEVNIALDALGKKAGLQFPDRGENFSPAKRPKSPLHSIKHYFSVLYFKDRANLEREVQTFLEWQLAFRDYDEKLDYLQTRLRSACEEWKRTQSGIRSDLSGLNICALEAAGNGPERESPPPSPSMSVKHAPKTPFDVSMINPEASKIDLPPPTCVDSAATSFTSNMKKSFSIFSEGTKASQEAPTSPATSVNTDLDLDGANDFVDNDLKDSQYSRYGGPLNSSMDPEGLDRIYEEANGARFGYPTLPDSPVEHLPFQQPQEQLPSPEKPKLAEKPPPLKQPLPTTPSSKIKSERQPEDSPSRRALFRVNNIPADGLTQLQLPDSFSDLSFDLRWECYRVLQTKAMTAENLDRRWTTRTMASLHQLTKDEGMKFSSDLETDFLKHTLCAKLRWNKTDVGPVFDLELLPPRQEKSNNLQRKFGSSRFLYIDIPSLSRPPKSTGLAQDARYIQKRFLEMISNAQNLLGRTWRQFHVQMNKAVSAKDPDFAVSGGAQIALFATGGDQLHLSVLRKLLAGRYHFMRMQRRRRAK